MNQPRALSALEALANVVAGFLVAFCAQLLLFPLVGLQATLDQSVWLALGFTLVSLLRSYLLRRLFDRIGGG